MNKSLTVSLILLLCVSYNLSTAQTDKNDTIVKFTVELRMNTSFDISCDDFIKLFKSSLYVSRTENPDTLKVFKNFIRNAKYATIDRSIDVRRKFIYRTDGKDAVSVCSNAFDIIVNGRLLKRNKRFLKFLDILSQ